MIRHKVINGQCYLYETIQTYKGKCKDHMKEAKAEEAGTEGRIA